MFPSDSEEAYQGESFFTQYDRFVYPTTEKKLKSVNGNLITMCAIALCHFGVRNSSS